VRHRAPRDHRPRVVAGAARDDAGAVRAALPVAGRGRAAVADRGHADHRRRRGRPARTLVASAGHRRRRSGIAHAHAPTSARHERIASTEEDAMAQEHAGLEAAEQAAAMLNAAGMPRMPARVMMALAGSPDDGYTAAELAGRLGV